MSEGSDVAASLVLTWVSIYWFSRAGADASTRIYYEVTHAVPNEFYELPYIPIPTGLSYFPKEILATPKS